MDLTFILLYLTVYHHQLFCASSAELPLSIHPLGRSLAETACSLKRSCLGLALEFARARLQDFGQAPSLRYFELLGYSNPIV